MDPVSSVILAALIFLAALIYSSVGHAGASGYLAAMALFSLSPAVMKPSALVLNIFVATIGSIQFYRAGHFSVRLFLPFAIGSIPCAFLGGSTRLPEGYYRIILGSILIFGAWRMIAGAAAATNKDESASPSAPPFAVAVSSGAGIGYLAGLTGVGGGIFLSPLLIMLHWATAKQTAAVSVAFILVNSISGLLGHLATVKGLPKEIGLWLAAAVIGGTIGSLVGSRRFDDATLRRVLAAVLALAGLKMLVG